jgi:hypothetical protein
VEQDDPVAQQSFPTWADVVAEDQIPDVVAGPTVDEYTGVEVAHGTGALRTASAGDRHACPLRKSDASCASIANPRLSDDLVTVQVQCDVVGPDDDAVARTWTDVAVKNRAGGDDRTTPNMGGLGRA